MSTVTASVWVAILRDVHRYPSPHNSQPIGVRIVDGHRADVLYDLDRGLPAEPYGIPFGHVCAGIFLELLAIAAHARGLDVVEDVSNADMDFDAAERLHHLARVALVPRDEPADDPGRGVDRQTPNVAPAIRRSDGPSRGPRTARRRPPGGGRQAANEDAAQSPRRNAPITWCRRPSR